MFYSSPKSKRLRRLHNEWRYTTSQCSRYSATARAHIFFEYNTHRHDEKSRLTVPRGISCSKSNHRSKDACNENVLMHFCAVKSLKIDSIRHK